MLESLSAALLSYRSNHSRRRLVPWQQPSAAWPLKRDDDPLLQVGAADQGVLAVEHRCSRDHPITLCAAAASSPWWAVEVSGGGDELGAAFEEAVVLGGELELGVGVQGAAQQTEEGADLVG